MEGCILSAFYDLTFSFFLPPYVVDTMLISQMGQQRQRISVFPKVVELSGHTGLQIQFPKDHYPDSGVEMPLISETGDGSEKAVRAQSVTQTRHLAS